MRKMTQTPIQSQQKTSRKQSKQRDLIKSSKTGKTPIKETLINGYVMLV